MFYLVALVFGSSLEFLRNVNYVHAKQLRNVGQVSYLKAKYYFSNLSTLRKIICGGFHDKGFHCVMMSSH